MRDPVFPAFCALAMVLVLLPLPWHWKARNTGTLLYIGWTFIGCLNFLVNSLVWAGNLSNPAPVWCDISTKIIVGQSVGMTVASLCIHRRLYNIATIQNVSVNRNTKRRNAIIDLCLGLGLPVLVMVLHYVVQGHRFDIIEDVGCWPSVYSTLLAIPMVYVWPVLIGTVALIYCTLTIRAFLETRRQFSQVLSASHSGLSMSRYFRLMALAATEILFTLPFSIYLLTVNYNGSVIINPWISWADTHQGFSRVDFIPWAVIENRPDRGMGFAVNLWALPAGGILFFVYFGMAGEASSEYSKWFWAAAGWFGFQKPAKTVKTSRWSNKIASSNATSAREVVTFPSRPTFDATQSSTSEPKKDTESKTEIESKTDIESLHTPTALEFSKPGDLEAQRPELK